MNFSNTNDGTKTETMVATRSVAHVVIALVGLVAGSVFVLLLSHSALGQQVSLDVEETSAHAGLGANAADVFKQKLMRQIDLEETTVRQEKSGMRRIVSRQRDNS